MSTGYGHHTHAQRLRRDIPMHEHPLLDLHRAAGTIRVGYVIYLNPTSRNAFANRNSRWRLTVMVRLWPLSWYMSSLTHCPPSSLSTSLPVSGPSCPVSRSAD